MITLDYPQIKACFQDTINKFDEYKDFITLHDPGRNIVDKLADVPLPFMVMCRIKLTDGRTLVCNREYSDYELLEMQHCYMGLDKVVDMEVNNFILFLHKEISKLKLI